jgi:hypothetical protein
MPANYSTSPLIVRDVMIFYLDLCETQPGENVLQTEPRIKAEQYAARLEQKRRACVNLEPELREALDYLRGLG